ncbi:MAG TPA: 2-C-methyl-D-erythritol 4-phosphate cytidylyltransferase, partial [Spirochaetota bacterium]|nr:2-C-methyl-D-erythritol 4-phosphate cytidylyltransferase [Spirochaetota bacterium]
MREKLIAVVLAAGKGSRFGGSKPKTFLKLYGKPVFWYSVQAFSQADAVDEIYLVVSEEMGQVALRMKSKYFKDIKKFKKIIIGGKERMDSVYNALCEIENSSENAYVALHDAARP